MSAQNPPASILELAERAELSKIWEQTKDFKLWLKAAERARHLGQSFDQEKDIENAFVEYAKAATLILDKIPTHREYYTRLDGTQRDTLITKGKGVLDRMGEIKPILIDRHNAWEESQASGAGPSNSRGTQPEFSTQSSQQREGENKLRKPSRQGSANSSKSANGMQIWYPDSGVVAQEKRWRGDATTTRNRAEHRTRAEQVGIVQRQREADKEAQVARQIALIHAPDIPNNFPASVPLTANSSQSSNYAPPPLLPLESPTHYHDVLSENDEALGGELYRRVADLTLQRQQPSPSPFNMAPYAPITTTSEPPTSLSEIQYPNLMSQHQRTQGYTPSLRSMFMDQHQSSMTVPPSTLLLEHTSPLPVTLYSNILPTPSQPSQAVTTSERLYSNPPSRASMFGPRDRPMTPAMYTNGHSHSPLSAPPPQDNPRRRSPKPPEVMAPRIAPASSSDRRNLDSHELKTVRFPREVLSRFISIASLNTAKNRETCGLLLGKSKGEKFVVTTLLIPRQHSTSDTCTMDEEELVLDFTEKRSLITLGWIHTHPTQSCFMSSVDLHTHSGFQAMLPESFAVVCAPQHTPNFGIFRLTDPPGLQTILSCSAKEAFHPHADVPIYTDADKGHVQMRDMALEIVDLR